MAAAALVSIYHRGEHAFVASSDQTTAGVWVGSGSVEQVGTSTPGPVGAAALTQLDRSELGVRHPRQDEWTARRRQALDPIVKLAGLRSWRSFIRDAVIVDVTRDGEVVRVTPMERDARRIEVFSPRPELAQELRRPTEVELGTAILAAVTQSGSGDLQT